MLAVTMLAALAPAYLPSATPAGSRLHRSAIVNMATLHVTGQGVTITEPMQEYADSKLSKPLDKFASMLNGPPEVHLKVEQRGVHDTEHHGREAHIAEVTAFCTDKAVIHASASSESMYASLDELSDMLDRKLRKLKEKKKDIKQTSRREDKTAFVEQMIDADEEEEEEA
jgi:putative sigma-54 modulation protein